MSTAESSPATVLEMFVGGAWRPSASGETFEATSPATGEVIGVDPPGRSLRRPGRRHRRGPGLPRVGGADRVRPRRRAAPRRRRLRAPPRRTRPRAHARPGQAAARGVLRRGRRAAGHAARCRRGRRAPGGLDPAERVAGQARAAHAPPAGARGRRDPVELALHDARRDRRPRSGGRQHGRLDAGAEHGRLLGAARRVRGGGRPPAGRLQLRHRARRGRRRRARRQPGDRRRRLHRLDRDGPADRRARGRQAPAARDGRQRARSSCSTAPTSTPRPQAAVSACFLCAGQSCTAGERLLVAEGVRDEFVERLGSAVAAASASATRSRDGTTMGPLNNEGVAAKMDEHVGDALTRGAARGRRRRALDGLPHRPLLDGHRPRRRRRGRRGRARGDLRPDRPRRPHPRRSSTRSSSPTPRPTACSPRSSPAT